MLRSDLGTVALICALDAAVLLAVAVLSATTPYDAPVEHYLIVAGWWVGAIMSWAYTRRRLAWPRSRVGLRAPARES